MSTSFPCKIWTKFEISTPKLIDSIAKEIYKKERTYHVIFKLWVHIFWERNW